MRLSKLGLGTYSDARIARRDLLRSANMGSNIVGVVMCSLWATGSNLEIVQVLVLSNTGILNEKEK